MHKNIVFFLIIILVLLIILVIFWFYHAQFTISRASSINNFSIDNSYIFITPLRAKADGNEKIRLTVFVLNNQGLGVPSKKIEISKDTNIIYDSIQPQTDMHGKAVFDLSSRTKGEYYLDIKVEGQLLPQKAHLSFN